MSLETRAIPHGKTWSNLGEHGEQGKHRKKGKHQPDDLKHSTYDPTTLSLIKTLYLSIRSLKTLSLMAPFENNITADN